MATSSYWIMTLNTHWGMGYAKQWIEDSEVNWWKTPAESPDLNPIKNLWHELKKYIWREVKPKTNEKLIQGMVEFLGTVNIRTSA